MTRNVTISLVAVGAFAVLVAGLLFVARPDSGSAAATPEQIAALSPPEAPRLNDAPGRRVRLVEFIDYQCPGCAALQPIMSQLVGRYGGDVEFVVRNFPLPMHRNSEPAAVAAEAAHQQGRFVPMYERLFRTQRDWGESEKPAGVFRGYAQDLGLDMAAYDRAVADPATLERVRADQQAGQQAGVDGTPSIFVNGRKVEVSSVNDITGALDAAVGR